jgi:hypothetical protein
MLGILGQGRKMSSSPQTRWMANIQPRASAKRGLDVSSRVVQSISLNFNRSSVFPLAKDYFLSMLIWLQMQMLKLYCGTKCFNLALVGRPRLRFGTPYVSSEAGAEFTVLFTCIFCYGCEMKDDPS